MKPLKQEQWRGKRMMSEGSTESCNNKERLHQSKRRPPGRLNWQERSAPSTLVQNIEVEMRSHENCKWIKRPIPISLPLGAGTRMMTRREAAVERKVRSGKSSTGPTRGVTDKDRQVLPGKSSPYPLRNRLSISERQAATGRTIPYLTRAGGVETARNGRRFQPHK
ncbi:hypothetical protein NPIL_276921 [Nephila pilipes]|uniref:Uncharacterized protein n=1 Tax=Nephila pilipes TaxID=299642 RepID=A0A8X6MV53_NEPPI|nr:hypothetical protein NPIL_276921 [Nephila pilipes]